MTLAVASAIPGSRVTVMKGIGHFPMIENYPLFRDYLLAELEAIVPVVT
jgi:pimeloyl-ACP methyl ester carboxylesterase